MTTAIPNIWHGHYGGTCKPLSITQFNIQSYYTNSKRIIEHSHRICGQFRRQRRTIDLHNEKVRGRFTGTKFCRCIRTLLSIILPILALRSN